MVFAMMIVECVSRHMRRECVFGEGKFWKL